MLRATTASCAFLILHGKLPGGDDEARARWGNRVAAGKLGVVHAPGRKPRLIGDSLK